MDIYFVIKTVHIISATILFGAGLSTAFFMWRSGATDSVREKYYAIRTTVLADYLFTAPAAIIQPATGVWLVWRGGYGWFDAWLAASYSLFIVAGACWLPVVWLQIRMRNLLADSVAFNKPLPTLYGRLFRVWFALGWPAFIALLVVFFLMVIRPT